VIKRICTIAAVFASLIVVTAPSQAVPEDVTGRYPPVETAQGLFLDCNKIDDNSKSFCVGYITGVFEVATNNPIDGISSCLRKLRNSNSIVKTTLAWIAAHPEKGQEPASTAIAEALADAYPCKH